MQCVEFENRLNDLLDERFALSVDIGLVEHAQGCARCCELLAAHEALLEGVAAMPVARLGEADRLTIAYRAAAEVGSAPRGPFQYGDRDYAGVDQRIGGRGEPATSPVELAPDRAAVVATSRAAPLALIGFVLASAAALLIALLPWFADSQQPVGPPDQNQLIVDSDDQRPPAPEDTTEVLRNYNGLALIARVGYQVADGLTPVTNSMVSALRELRKRPLFRSPEDIQGRSSSYLPRDADEMIA
jgi:hypothetical protein